jgi:hypothetical protein
MRTTIGTWVSPNHRGLVKLVCGAARAEKRRPAVIHLIARDVVCCADEPPRREAVQAEAVEHEVGSVHVGAGLSDRTGETAVGENARLEVTNLK